MKTQLPRNREVQENKTGFAKCNNETACMQWYKLIHPVFWRQLNARQMTYLFICGHENCNVLSLQLICFHLNMQDSIINPHISCFGIDLICLILSPQPLASHHALKYWNCSPTYTQELLPPHTTCPVSHFFPYSLCCLLLFHLACC